MSWPDALIVITAFICLTMTVCTSLVITERKELRLANEKFMNRQADAAERQMVKGLN